MEKDIQRRLDRYLSLDDEKVDTCETNVFESLPHIYNIFDTLDADRQINLFACERNNDVCVCKDGYCTCDSDDYSAVLKTELIHTSNNTLNVRMSFDHSFKTSQMKNVRVFSLHEHTDEEIPVMDVIKVIKKDRKKRKYVECARVVLGGKCYDVDGNPRVTRGDMLVSIQYMHWSDC